MGTKKSTKAVKKVLENVTDESTTREKIEAHVEASLKVNRERECIDFPSKVKDFMGKKTK